MQIVSRPAAAANLILDGLRPVIADQHIAIAQGRFDARYGLNCNPERYEWPNDARRAYLRGDYVGSFIAAKEAAQAPAPLIDMVAAAYELGKADQAAGKYAPPAPNDEHDAYIRGHNDAWAAADNVTWWSRKGN